MLVIGMERLIEQPVRVLLWDIHLLAFLSKVRYHHQDGVLVSVMT
jgi:hypothetical protein